MDEIIPVLTFGKAVVESAEALPERAIPGTCWCGGTQFRIYQTKGETHAVCPTCGTPFTI